MRRKSGKRGFTLIEIAVVLVIVGLLIGATVTGVQPVVLSSKISQTNTKMDRIELALLAYVMQNGCLPCPANGQLGSAASSPGNTAVSSDAGWSYGAPTRYYGPNHATNNQPCAAPTGTGCQQTVGVVPWNSLGLRDADTVDQWQNRITYAVTSSLTVTAGTSMARTAPTSYPVGGITVENNAGTDQTTVAAYVLISHGPDRSYGFAAQNGATMANSHSVTTTNQNVNNPSAGTATTFRQDRAVTGEGATYFDDIVRFKTAPVIVQTCGKNACGNPA